MAKYRIVVVYGPHGSHFYPQVKSWWWPFWRTIPNEYPWGGYTTEGGAISIIFGHSVWQCGPGLIQHVVRQTA